MCAWLRWHLRVNFQPLCCIVWLNPVSDDGCIHKRIRLSRRLELYKAFGAHWYHGTKQIILLFIVLCFTPFSCSLEIMITFPFHNLHNLLLESFYKFLINRVSSLYKGQIFNEIGSFYEIYHQTKINHKTVSRQFVLTCTLLTSKIQYAYSAT